MNRVVRNALLAAAAGAGAALAGRELLRWRRRIDLAGRVVLVTGGSRGLGLVLARELAARGARLVLCARDADELDRASKELSGRGARVVAIPCDVTDREDVARMVRLAREACGRIDAVINNAGVIQAGPLEVTTLQDYEDALKTHFWAPLYTTMEVLPEMRARKSGRIVNISSIGGAVSVPHLVPYSASKFALRGLSEGMRAELLKDGIHVTTVLPGLMRTGSPRNAQFKGRHRAEYAWFSIGDSLPGLSIGAEAAARAIVGAMEHGDPELIVSLPAKVAAVFHGLFPGVTADLLGAVNALLPGPGGIGTRAALGKDSTSRMSPSWITALTEAAARRNNEVAPGES
ncbi:Fatty acyl-CoA reductase [Aquisphaera giovannonii]|uniref:Fatty acyl-CoA reductase n=1 Tax=Aquisphaera giovannonii TaxID=406548 RepID=A0A5B9W783_9BACT|nr:SDR family NAD(P)-dependent oxidoreductase [Aquisphaera giovannonii]QEH36114.1 Fatty acyl-CoA reductase [Aquisphaera giovannonii]